MLFNSLEFAIFFPIVTALYFAVPFRFRWFLLLSASCFFYMFFKPVYILILGFTIFLDYFVGIYLNKLTSHTHRKQLLVLSLIANIGVLFVFKYFNFINDNITAFGHAAGFKNAIPYLNIILPIGLSFHTFQAMSYTIEVYRRNQEPEKHLGYYALYVMYYPQLVAGPIERPQNVLHQFHTKHSFNYQRTVEGLRLVLWGLFKKIIIADSLAYFVNDYYGNVFNTSNNSAIAMVFFSFQIYCDFSGYSDVAIGTSKVMGIELMQNFNYPYFSHTVTQFWRRWHISLSTWFRDYLYIPLGGSKSAYFYIRNTLIVFLISGLWHGANWTFIVWGAIHGLLIIFEKLTNISKSKNILLGLFSFVMITIAWVFFRAENFQVARQVILNLANSQFTYDFIKIGYVIFLLVLFLVIEYLVYKRQVSTVFDLLKHKVARYVLYILMIELILISFNKVISQQFIYFQF